MSFWYTLAKRLAATAEFDWAADDIRAILVMSGTTADSEEDTDFIDQFTDLDEYDGASYAREELATKVVNNDLANDWIDLSADDIVFATLGAGTNPCIGIVLYVHVTNDADSYPIAFLDGPAFPFDGTGADKTIFWNGSVVLRVA